SFGESTLLTSNPFTSPAICEAKGVGSKRLILLMPDLPATIAAQASLTELPTGQTVPSPVTTTLRLDNSTPCQESLRALLLLQVRVDIVHGLLHRGDLLGFFVRDLALELFLQSHDQLDGIERVRSEVIDEGRFGLDIRIVHAQLLGHDLLHALFNGFHQVPFRLTRVGGGKSTFH